jgi:hypothetical protein
MESLAAVLIVMLQFFFGWCSEDPRPAPPEPPPGAASVR